MNTHAKHSSTKGQSRRLGDVTFMSAYPPIVFSNSGSGCSLIPGLGVKLSTIILAGPTVLSAVGRALRMMA